MRAAKERWRKRGWGARVVAGATNLVTNLWFADDVLLVGSSLFQVRAVLSDLIIEAQKVGLEVHPDKTKIINNGFGQGQSIESVEAEGMHVQILKREEGTMYLRLLLNIFEVHDTEIEH